MKFNRKTISFTLSIAVFLLSGFVAPGSHVNHDSLESITPVNQEIRLAHARELLGEDLLHHRASHIKSGSDLSQFILKELSERLPAEYKEMAPTITQVLIRESESQQLDPMFVLALIETESKFNPLARGRHGEIGLMQIKPSTAKWLAHKYKHQYNGDKSLLNPLMNIRYGVMYIKFLRESFDSSASHYVNAYNVGPTRLRQLRAAEIIPVQYSNRVLSAYQRMYEQI